MPRRMYGNVINRFEEGKTVPEIKVGTDITMYYWSDRECYYVTEVIDQKHIKVKEYKVCADHDKEPGMGHQNWVYFKTMREYNDYISKYFPDRYMADIKEPKAEDWVFRYGYWNRAYIYTKDTLDEMSTFGTPMRNILDPKDVEKIEAGKVVTKYSKIEEGLSFGKRDYYWDWSF